jgi:hypothetical protein
MGYALAAFFLVMWLIRIRTSNTWKETALDWRDACKSYESATEAWKKCAYDWKESAEESQRICFQYRDTLVKALEGKGFPRQNL